MAEDLFANIEIPPREVKKLLVRGDGFLFVDVRKIWEHDTSRIEGATLIPIREIPANVVRLQDAASIVLFAIMGCVASMQRRGCVRKESMVRARCRVGSIAGRSK